VAVINVVVVVVEVVVVVVVVVEEEEVVVVVVVVTMKVEMMHLHDVERTMKPEGNRFPG
jgi:hypothetical protein